MEKDPTATQCQVLAVPVLTNPLSARLIVFPDIGPLDKTSDGFTNGLAHAIHLEIWSRVKDSIFMWPEFPATLLLGFSHGLFKASA